jgi:CheY-like chemotaxis protein
MRCAAFSPAKRAAAVRTGRIAAATPCWRSAREPERERCHGVPMIWLSTVEVGIEGTAAAQALAATAEQACRGSERPVGPRCQAAARCLATSLRLRVMDYRPEKEPHRPTVLIVEDEPDIRHPLAEYLRDTGYLVFEAANSSEAIAIIADENLIDLVFSDIRMPGGMDGLGLARRIRRRHPGVRIVLTSGTVDAVSADIAEFFVSKPYHVADVAARIGRLLSGPVPSTPSRGLLAERPPEKPPSLPKSPSKSRQARRRRPTSRRSRRDDP